MKGQLKAVYACDGRICRSNIQTMFVKLVNYSCISSDLMNLESSTSYMSSQDRCANYTGYIIKLEFTVACEVVII